MDFNALLQSAVTASPFAGLLLWLLLAERKERRELQAKLMKTLELQVKHADAVRQVLEKNRSRDDD